MENRTGYQQRTVWGESFRNPSEAGLSEGAGNQWNISESHYEGRIQSTNTIQQIMKRSIRSLEMRRVLSSGKGSSRSRIRVMVDAVFNHCGPKFAPWLDVQEKGQASEYADWFMINDWSDLKKKADTRDGRFYSFAFADGMPKLNTNNDEVAEYLTETCEYWIKEFGIDGLRLDVPMRFPINSAGHCGRV